MNDTGLNILSLFTTDLLHLGPNIQECRGWIQPTHTIDANCMISVWPAILGQIFMTRDDYSAWGNLIDEVL